MKLQAVAVDVGGTNVRVALVDHEGKIRLRRSQLTEARKGRVAVLERLLTVMNEVVDSAEPGTLCGIGVSQAGATDPGTGAIHSPPNLPGWDGYSLKPDLERHFSLPVVVANDANAAAVAEQRYGAARGYSSVFYMTVSTGIGGGAIIDGKLDAGSRGYAGEVGHMTIDKDGPECSCGNRGCLEWLASGTAVARIARERLSSGEPSEMHASAGGEMQRVDAPMVVEAARSGDRLANAIVQEVAANLGVGIVNLVHLLDPEVVVIGGGLGQHLDILLPGITAELKTRELSGKGERIRVVKSELGDDGPLLGAAALAFEASAGLESVRGEV